MTINIETIVEWTREFARHIERPDDPAPSRRSVLSFAVASAAFEKWLQFEFGAWLSAKTMLDVVLERAGQARSHIDLWIMEKEAQRFAAGEIKCIYNNKNLKDSVWSVRSDVASGHRIPSGVDANQVLRFGIAALVYLDYGNPDEVRYSPDPECRSSEVFVSKVLTELTVNSTWYGGLRGLSPYNDGCHEHALKTDINVSKRAGGGGDLKDVSVHLLALFPNH